MPQYSPALLKIGNENWQDVEVDVVTFPAPPVKAKGVLYPADRWHSSTLDRAEGLFGEGKVLAVAMTQHGPTFLLRWTLGKLFDERADVEPIYCATISYVTAYEENGLTYAKASILEKVMEIDRSCHPASHTAVPGAPYLTTLLELSCAAGAAGKLQQAAPDYRYNDDQGAGGYFPEHDFSGNEEADRLFRYMNLSHAFGTVLQHDIRVPQALSQRLRRLVINELVGNENFAIAYGGDPRKYMQVVDLRNELAAKEA